MSFGENLQYFRSESGLTQEQLAERLEVTRQSVSKWESDASFPEMDKILVLCDMFHCDLDTLLRGDAKAARQSDTAGYDAHMNRFAKMITAGVVLCICGLSAACLADAFARDDRWSGILFLLFALVAAVLFILGGIHHHDFCEHNPHIEPFYDKETLAQWRQKFPVFIAVGVAICIGAAILTVLLEDMPLGKFAQTGGNAIAGAPAIVGGAVVASENVVASEEVSASVGFLLAAVGVGLLVYGSIQNHKYHIDTYNRKRDNEKMLRQKRLAQIHRAIMLTATGVFLVYWWVCRTLTWNPKWDWLSNIGIGFGVILIYGISWIACAVVSTLFDPKPKD